MDGILRAVWRRCHPMDGKMKTTSSAFTDQPRLCHRKHCSLQQHLPLAVYATVFRTMFPWIFSRTLRFYYVTSSPGSPLPHLLDGHSKLVGRSAIQARSCPGPVRYHWGSIVELEVPPDETPGLMTLQPHNTNVTVLQSITYAKSPYPPDRSNSGQKNSCFQHEYG